MHMDCCKACSCVQVYDVAIETIFLAFCYDCEAHGGHPRHAPQLLLSTVESLSMFQRRGDGQRGVSEAQQRSRSEAHHERSSVADQQRRSEAQHERSSVAHQQQHRNEAQYEYDA